MTDCVIRSRIDPLIKAEAIEVFEKMGLTLSQAIRLFLYQSVAEHKIPFSVNIPNAKTRSVIELAEQGKHLEKTSLKQLSEEWDE
jgi:DNA-damage-inducible protein J